MDEQKNSLFKCIGAKVTYYRTLRGLTQRELAEKIGISPSTLNKVERGAIIRMYRLLCYWTLLKGWT